MKNQLRPTGQLVLVEPIMPQKQVGSIIVPETATEKWPAQAIVLAIGPKSLLDIKVGDHVYTNRFEGTDVVVAGRHLRLLEPEQVLGLIEQTD